MRNWLADAAWVQRELPRRARTAGADVVHHPLPAHARAVGTAQVITVHDLAFERLPEAFDRRYATWARRAHRAAARRADAVVCPTEATARDVRARWGVPAARVVVAPHGAIAESVPSFEKSAGPGGGAIANAPAQMPSTVG